MLSWKDVKKQKGQVCWTGRTTAKEKCGSILGKDKDKLQKDNGYFQITKLPQQGDSGSLLYAKPADGTGVVAVGMITGGYKLTGIGQVLPIEAIESELGVSVLTTP